MSAVLVNVPAAIVTVLNGAGFRAYIASLAIMDEWTAARSYAQFKEELKNIGQLKVDVVPVTHSETKLGTRGSVTFRTVLEICIRKKFAANATDSASGIVTVAAVDQLVELVQRVYTFFATDGNRELPDVDASAWVNGKIKIPYHRKHLDDLRQFTAVIKLEYQTDRAL